MPYQLDVSAIPLMDYKELLRKQNLLPGRRLLWQGLDGNFAAIAGQGVANVAQLKKQLATPVKLANFAAATGIAQPYLTLLKRELGSLESKPVPIASFPGLAQSAVATLEQQGIRNSKEGYEHQATVEAETFGLCDLVRINGVGAVAARAFWEAGYRSAADVAKADATEMLARVSAVNEQNGYYKAKLGIKDMQFCIHFACLLVHYGG